MTPKHSISILYILDIIIDSGNVKYIHNKDFRYAADTMLTFCIWWRPLFCIWGVEKQNNRVNFQVHIMWNSWHEVCVRGSNNKTSELLFCKGFWSAPNWIVFRQLQPGWPPVQVRFAARSLVSAYDQLISLFSLLFCQSADSIYGHFLHYYAQVVTMLSSAH